MELNSGDTAWAVRQALLNLLELIDTVTDVPNREELRAEAKKTMMGMASAVIMADGAYGDREHAFVSELLEWEPGENLSYLNDNSELWTRICNEVPGFFRAAVRFDRDIARAMLREIQFIGNNVSIADGEFQPVERKMVARYIASLESALDDRQPNPRNPEAIGVPRPDERHPGATDADGG